MGYQIGRIKLSNPVDFIRDFLKYTKKVGIFDEFDKDKQQMVTSAGVTALIKQAQACLPEKIGNLEAATRMRNLTDAERDKLIADAEDARVVDMRKEFQRRMSVNGGAQGLLAKLVEANATGDNEAIGEVLEDATALLREVENSS